MTDIQSAIEDQLAELRSEIERLELARDALNTDGTPARGRRHRGRAKAQPRQPGSASARRRRRQTRMDPREREAQALHRIREHGANGVSITDLAAEVGVSRSYLASRILPPLDAQITRMRGRVAAK
jgi:hypothetical protein